MKTTPKPFESNPEALMEKMTEAANGVLDAIRALEMAKNNVENWAEWETLEHFKKDLHQFMICDNGEAGFQPYLETKAEKVFRGRHNPILAARKRADFYNRQGRAIKVSIPTD
jgi:hypothetical protein